MLPFSFTDCFRRLDRMPFKARKTAFEKGRAEGRMEVARNMKSLGIVPDVIMKAIVQPDSCSR